MSARDAEHWLWEIGEAGQRLTQLGALEGTAGNISLFLPSRTPGLEALLTGRLSYSQAYVMPLGNELPAGVLLVTGAGARLRDAAARPETVLCALAIAEDGATQLHRAPDHDVRPTSELDSHIGIHAALLAGHAVTHAVVHAQPRSLTYLSHIPSYRDAAHLNHRLMRWQPETLVTFPEGVGSVPFKVPGTPEQGHATVTAMRHHRLIIWAKHGVVARSHAGPLAAADLIEYAETAASYELLDLQLGQPADGLNEAEQRAIAARFGVAWRDES